jgi:glycosyltransferase involved in cell wall biosynthesis
LTSPLVTILTTTYNHSKLIGNCVRSVQRQTFKEYEHIIIDDGSTDGTGDVVRSLVDSKTTYIYQGHVGISRLKETCNQGLHEARGKYIAILEGDDYYPPWKLERQIGSLEDDDVVLSFGKVVTVDPNHRFLGVNPSARQFRGKIDWLNSLIVRNYITALTVMMKRDALLRVGGFIQPEGVKAVDYATFLELALTGKFKFVDEILGYWVRHGGNYSDVDLYKNAEVGNWYAIEFCRKHGIPVPWEKLRHQRGRDLFHVGRHYLMDRNKSEAVKCFHEAFNLGELASKIKSLGGIGMANLGVDFEEISRLLGRPVER